MPHRFRPHRAFAFVLSLAVSSFAVAATPSLPPVASPDRLDLRRCGPDAWCGRLLRPIDSAGRVPGDIGIAFQLVTPRRPDLPFQGTVVAVEGGPGYPSIGTGGSYRALMGPLLDDHELLIVDNRGTGGSGVVNCPSLQRGDGPTVRAIGACGRSLGERSALYGTADAADDLDAVLEALGRPQVSLFGDSYGTWFAQVFAHRHPARLRSLVLDSAYPVRMGGGESPWYPFFAPTMRREFDAVCARTPSCAALPGSGIDHIVPALDALRAAPFDAQALDADGKLQTFRADPSALALVMFAGAPPFTVARELDAAARAFTEGDRAPLLRLMAEARSASDPRYGPSPLPYSEGLFWAVSCHDYAQVYDMTLPPPLRRAQRDRVMAERARDEPGTYAPFTIDEYRGMSLDYSLLDACVDWPVPPAAHPPGPPIPPDGSLPDVPVLVLSGELDTITTPAEGALVAGSFPQALHLVVANRFHLVALPPQTDPCALDIVRRFLRTGSPGDTRCVEQVPPLRAMPRFSRHAAELPLPIPGPGNAADTVRQRAAVAAVLGLGDALDRAESNVNGRAPGLRGGVARISLEGDRRSVTLKDYRWTEDVRVDGHLAWPVRGGIASARVHLRTEGGLRGVLDVQWREGDADALASVRGTIGGQRVDVWMTPP